MPITCPVCGYDHLEFPPANFSICACCGTEFGYDDRVLTHDELRRRWVQRGCPWFDLDESKPVAWNPYMQLINSKHAEAIPQFASKVKFEANTTIGPGKT